MEQIRQLEADSERYMTIAKVKGLPAVKNFLMTQSAKIGGYTLIKNIPQETHNKVMNGDINTFYNLRNVEEEYFDDMDSPSFYTYLIQEIKSERRIEPIYVIDSIFIQ